MAVGDREIEHLEALSRMTVEKDLRATIKEQLGKILDYVRQLDELDTSDVEPTVHVHTTNVEIREDVEAPCLSPDLALREAPAKDRGQFLVPRILEDDSTP